MQSSLRWAPWLGWLACVVLIGACGGGGGGAPPAGNDPGETAGANYEAVPTSGRVNVKSVSGPYTVDTVFGSYPVNGAGEFDAVQPAAELCLASVHDAQGHVVSLGFTHPTESWFLSERSTAIVLLYMYFRGWMLPPEEREALIDLLSGIGGTAQIQRAIEEELAKDPAALESANQAILDAVVQFIAAVNNPPPAYKSLAVGWRAVQAPTNLLLQPDATVSQSGVNMWHDPAGSGVIFYNKYRRRSRVLAYLMSRTENGTETFEDPPVHVGELDIPSTQRLSLFGATIDSIRSGQVALVPVTRGPLLLPLPEGAERADYEVVLIGPNLSGDKAPIFFDARFAAYWAEWEGILEDLNFETFLADFLLPAVELLAGGVGIASSSAAYSQELATFRSVLDPVWAARGFSFRSGSSFVDAMNIAFENLKENDILRRDLWGKLVSAGLESKANEDLIERGVRNLRSRLRVAVVLTVVDAALTALDAYKVVSDLSNSKTADSWQAVVVPKRVRLEPTHSEVDDNNRSVIFTASVNGLPEENFWWRWSCTSRNGLLSTDLGDPGPTFVTREDQAQYIATLIGDGPQDVITVEVFSDGPMPGPGDTPLNAAAATVFGDFKEVAVCRHHSDYAPADWQGSNMTISINPMVVYDDEPITFTLEYLWDETTTGNQWLGALLCGVSPFYRRLVDDSVELYFIVDGEEVVVAWQPDRTLFGYSDNVTIRGRDTDGAFQTLHSSSAPRDFDVEGFFPRYLDLEFDGRGSKGTEVHTIQGEGRNYTRPGDDPGGNCVVPRVRSNGQTILTGPFIWAGQEQDYFVGPGQRSTLVAFQTAP